MKGFRFLSFTNLIRKKTFSPFDFPKTDYSQARCRAIVTVYSAKKVFSYLQASTLRHANFENHTFGFYEFLKMPVINLKIMRPLVDDVFAVVAEVGFQRIVNDVQIRIINFSYSWKCYWFQRLKERVIRLIYCLHANAKTLLRVRLNCKKNLLLI